MLWERTQRSTVMQIACLTLALYPLRIRTQAIKAIGKAKQSLWINAVFAIASNGLLLIFVFVSLKAAIVSMLLAEAVFAVMTGVCIQRDFDYSLSDQFTDVVTSYIIGGLMVAVVMSVGSMFTEVSVISLFAKVFGGIAFYILISLLGKPKPVKLILSYLKAGQE